MGLYKVLVIAILLKNNSTAKFGELVDEKFLSKDAKKLVEEGFVAKPSAKEIKEWNESNGSTDAAKKTPPADPPKTDPPPPPPVDPPVDNPPPPVDPPVDEKKEGEEEKSSTSVDDVAKQLAEKAAGSK